MTRAIAHESLAFGTPSDVSACAQIFDDVATAMTDALNRVNAVNATPVDSWQGETADAASKELTDVPDLLQDFKVANELVGFALHHFAGGFTDYEEERARLEARNSQLAEDIDRTHRQRDAAAERVRSDPNSIAGLTLGLLGTDSDPEVSALDSRLAELQIDRDVLQRLFDENDGQFLQYVDSVVEAIRDADGFLYNGGFDQWWSQNAKPFLEVVRTVIEVVAVIVTIVVIFSGAGTLVALALGAMLLTLSLVDVLGTAASGREVTGEQWLNLGLDAFSVVTLGMANKAASAAKLANGANKAAAAKALTSGKNVATKVPVPTGVGTMAVPGGATAVQSGAATAASKVRPWELAEGAANIGGGAYLASQGDVAAGAGMAVGGVFDVGGGLRGWDMGGRRIVEAGKEGVTYGVGLVSGGSDSKSPSEWPGLDADALED